MSEEKKETGLSIVKENTLPELSEQERDAIREQVREGMSNVPMKDILSASLKATMKAFASGKVNLQSIVEEAMVETVALQKQKQLQISNNDKTALNDARPESEPEPGE